MTITILFSSDVFINVLRHATEISLNKVRHETKTEVNLLERKSLDNVITILENPKE